MPYRDNSGSEPDISPITENPVLTRLRERMVKSSGDQLSSLVIYGAAAHGDFYEEKSEFHVLIVLRDLSLGSLTTIREPIRWWLRKHQPMPRVFSPKVLVEAADVFPIEFLDIVKHHIVLHGKNPFANLVVHTDHLRIQCERELREKMLRLREAYLEAARPRDLERLLSDSFSAFVPVFRGCLHLTGETVPVHDADVVRSFCHQANLDVSAFEQVEKLKHKQKPTTPLQSLFASYYEQLSAAVSAVDQFAIQERSNIL